MSEEIENALQALRETVADMKKQQEHTRDALNELAGKIEVIDDSLSEDIEAAKKEVLEKLAELDAFAHNIIEKNQSILNDGHKTILAEIQGIGEDENGE